MAWRGAVRCFSSESVASGEWSGWWRWKGAGAGGGCIDSTETKEQE